MSKNSAKEIYTQLTEWLKTRKPANTKVVNKKTNYNKNR